MVPFADSEGPAQTVRIRMLILTFYVRIRPNTRFRMARKIIQTLVRQGVGGPPFVSYTLWKTRKRRLYHMTRSACLSVQTNQGPFLKCGNVRKHNAPNFNHSLFYLFIYFFFLIIERMKYNIWLFFDMFYSIQYPPVAPG